jgi:hypothetical protein
MEDNKNELTPAKKAQPVEFSFVETAIHIRRNDLNFPALQAMFDLTEAELQAILDKLPPLEDCNC